MSGGGGTSLRKALGALKDTTTVSLAKVNSDYKVLQFVCSPLFVVCRRVAYYDLLNSHSWILNCEGIGHCYC